MNKQLISALLLVLGLSFLLNVYIQEVMLKPETATTTTSTIVQVSSLTCVKIGPEQLERLRISGVPLAFENNMWFIDDTQVASAEYEDEEFSACGAPELIDEIYAIAYGG